jgi:hypothetical protein
MSADRSVMRLMDYVMMESGRGPDPASCSVAVEEGKAVEAMSGEESRGRGPCWQPEVIGDGWRKPSPGSRSPLRAMHTAEGCRTEQQDFVRSDHRCGREQCGQAN